MPFDPECDRGELAWDLFPNGIHFCVTYRLLKQGKDTSAQVIVSGLVSPVVTGMLCHIMTGRITARDPGQLNRLRFSELDTTMTGNNECHNNAIPGWFFFPNILLSCWKIDFSLTLYLISLKWWKFPSWSPQSGKSQTESYDKFI